MDRIEIPGYPDTNNSLDSAHVVWDDGHSLTIVAVVPEPQERIDSHGVYGSDWDEDAYIAALTAAVTDLWGDPDDSDVTITLVIDPARDNQREVIIFGLGRVED